MVSVASKKTVVRKLVESGFAKINEVCRALNLSRSSFYASSKRSYENLAFEKRILELSDEHPRYGYRRITALMKREGLGVNSKRVQRVRARHQKQVRKKQRRSRRLSSNKKQRLRASTVNEVWSWDFVHDQTEWGTNYRILSVIDEHSKQCHSLRPRHSYKATNVIEVLEELISEHGAPKFIRSDNGPEFIAYQIQDWLRTNGIKTHYITPGSPWEQCYIESFHDKLRDEFLNREIFYSLEEANIMLEGWRVEYNDDRIHSSLNYLTPNEYAASVKTPLRATPCAPSLREQTNIENLRTRNQLLKSTV